MLTRHTQRRLVAAIAGIVLLLCQSLALAQACSLLPRQPDQSQSQPPCHATGEQDEANTASSQGECKSISPIASGFSLFSIDELPAVIVRFASSDFASAPAPLSLEPPLLLVDPPPLRIVHCCLRN